MLDGEAFPVDRRGRGVEPPEGIVSVASLERLTSGVETGDVVELPGAGLAGREVNPSLGACVRIGAGRIIDAADLSAGGIVAVACCQFFREALASIAVAPMFEFSTLDPR